MNDFFVEYFRKKEVASCGSRTHEPEGLAPEASVFDHFTKLAGCQAVKSRMFLADKQVDKCQNDASWCYLWVQTSPENLWNFLYRCQDDMFETAGCLHCLTSEVKSKNNNHIEKSQTANNFCSAVHLNKETTNVLTRHQKFHGILRTVANWSLVRLNLDCTFFRYYEACFFGSFGASALILLSLGEIPHFVMVARTISFPAKKFSEIAKMYSAIIRQILMPEWIRITYHDTQIMTPWKNLINDHEHSNTVRLTRARGKLTVLGNDMSTLSKETIWIRLAICTEISEKIYVQICYVCPSISVMAVDALKELLLTNIFDLSIYNCQFCIVVCRFWPKYSRCVVVCRSTLVFWIFNPNNKKLAERKQEKHQ